MSEASFEAAQAEADAAAERSQAEADLKGFVKDHKNYIAASRAVLEAQALRYARMKLHGEYIDGYGNRCVPFPTDAAALADQYGKDLLRVAEDLLKEISLTPLPPREGS